MTNIKDWQLQEFPYGELISQRIDFSVDDHNFFMIFTPVITSDIAYVSDRETVVGFKIPDKSYDVKFDRVENFENDTFYEPPTSDFTRMSPSKMRRLGRGICKLIEYHCSVTQAEAYFASAESNGLKQFYDRLAKNYTSDLNYQISTDLGDEGLGYAVRTANFKQQN